MKFNLILLFVSFTFFSFTTKNSSVKETSPAEFSTMTSLDKMLFIEEVYNNLETNKNALPKLKSFEKGLLGFYALKEKGMIQKDVLTVIDFSLSSTKKRLWVIDLATNTILYHSFVSHGMNSGGEYATRFSNAPDSNKSSLGFFTTGETYTGKHGLSLKLDGQERGINDNARQRAVVMHGAKYANPTILKSQGFLGRSQGCPAIPEGLKNRIIETIKGKSCLFIYHPSSNYEIASKLIS